MDRATTNEIKKEPMDVMRLKIKGSETTVNTIKDQQTARGLSLICPFPTLNVDIPIEFGDRAGSTMQEGTIHRIGVEDDPENGLPKLKLSIRTKHGRSTIISAPTDSLIGESSRMTKAPNLQEFNAVEATITTDEAANKSHIDDPKPIFDHMFQEEPAELGEIELESITDDPSWIECGDLPSPDEICDRSKTRRNRRLAAVASWMMVLGLLTGGGYVLNNSGLLNVQSMKNNIMSVFSPSKNARDIQSNSKDQDINALVQEAMNDAPATVATVVPTAATSSDALISNQEGLATNAIAPAGPNPESTTEANTVSSFAQASAAAVSTPKEVEKPQEPAKTEIAYSAEEKTDVAQTNSSFADSAESAIKNADSNSSAQAAAEAAPVTQETDDADKKEVIATKSEPIKADDISFVLPTRWPAEYSSAYRLRDPNGVVVDVPGGLVKKEGWLEMARNYTMIRSIKAIQRETGARFVIFINGNLPRFMTSPKTGGVLLRLYHDENADPSQTEQVALLEK